MWCSALAWRAKLKRVYRAVVLAVVAEGAGTVVVCPKVWSNAAATDSRGDAMICVMDDCLDIVRDVTEGRWTLSVVGGLGRKVSLPVDGEVEPNIGILEMDEDRVLKEMINGLRRK